MGNGDHAAWELHQQVFKPLNGIEIQMVGWLIQQEYIRPGDQRLRECDAFLRPARQVAYASGRIEMQALQGFFDALFPVPGVVCLDLGLQCIKIQPFGARQILLAQRNHLRKTLRCRFKNRRRKIEIRLLCHIGNAHALLHMACAIVEVGQSAKYLEK